MLNTADTTWLAQDERYLSILDACCDDVAGEATPRGTVILCGESQSGKTRLVNYWANLRGLDVLTVNAQLDSPEDISGYPFRPSGGQIVRYTNPQIIPQEYIDRRDDFVIFIDELDKTPEATLVCLLTLLSERRIRHTVVYPRAIVCACNLPKRPLPAPLMARLLWVPYPPKGYSVLERSSLVDVMGPLEDIYGPPEPQLPELELWYGSAHRLAAWYRHPQFWLPEVQELVLHGSFPTAQADAILHKLQDCASVDGVVWAAESDAATVAASIVPIMLASQPADRNNMVNILHRRATEDVTGELKYALTAWVSSPAAQAITDGQLGGLTAETIDELRTLANSEMAKAIRKQRKEQNEENL